MTVIAPLVGNSAANPETKDIFSSEENILRALSFVRHSPIPVKEKDTLRDLFLSFTGTYDEAGRKEIKSKISELLRSNSELSSLLPKSKTTEGSIVSKTAAGIGASRPVPSFAPISRKMPETSATGATPKDTAEPPPPVAPVPVEQKVTVEPPTPVTEPAAPKESTTPITVTPTPGTKARIDAIKRDINGKFGNPVNLIDKHEQIGREYMSALLDAMKRSGRGDADLSRLEAAYQAALTVSSSEPTSTTRPPEPPTLTKAPRPETVVPKVSPKVMEATSEVPKIMVTPPALISSPAISITPKPPERAPVKTSGSGLYHQPADEAEEPTKSIQSETIKQPFTSTSTIPPRTEAITTTKEKESAPPVEKTPVVATKQTPPPASSPKSEVITSVVNDSASDKPRSVRDIDTALPEQISKLKAAASAREEAEKKPIVDLNAPVIEQGLKQLLSEWTLFRGGGFLRSKPSGLDNPLYKQLSKLPMASVVAGRFEGVTPEIKRELADYMTGWRYERGVVHELGETFEHYLRRVVKEILETQRKAAAAAITDGQK